MLASREAMASEVIAPTRLDWRGLVLLVLTVVRFVVHKPLGAVLIGVTGWSVEALVSSYISDMLGLIVQCLADAMMAVSGPSLDKVIIAIVIGILAPVIRTVRFRCCR